MSGKAGGGLAKNAKKTKWEQDDDDDVLDDLVIVKPTTYSNLKTGRLCYESWRSRRKVGEKKG